MTCMNDLSAIALAQVYASASRETVSTIRPPFPIHENNGKSVKDVPAMTANPTDNPKTWKILTATSAWKVLQNNVVPGRARIRSFLPLKAWEHLNCGPRICSWACRRSFAASKRFRHAVSAARAARRLSFRAFCRWRSISRRALATRRASVFNTRSQRRSKRRNDTTLVDGKT